MSHALLFSPFRKGNDGKLPPCGTPNDELPDAGPYPTDAITASSAFERAALVVAGLNVGCVVQQVRDAVDDHPHRASADAVFSGIGIANAIPSMSAHIHIEEVGPNPW